MSTTFEYYLPGLDHEALTDEAWAGRWGHLQYIRQQELKTALQIQGVGR